MEIAARAIAHRESIFRLHEDDKQLVVAYAAFYASRLKGCPVPMVFGDTAEASETNSSPNEAYTVLGEEWSAENNKALEFVRIIRNLPFKDLVLLHDHLGQWHRMENRGTFVEEAKSSNPGPLGSFVMNSAAQAVGAAVAKTVVEEVLGWGDDSPHSIKHFKPYADAATVGGLVLVCGAIFLKEKKPGLSKFMVKSGLLSIAFATLPPVTAALPPVTAIVYGLLAGCILLGTALLA